MEYKEFANTKAVETFKEFLEKYESGEILEFSITIDGCRLAMEPLGSQCEESSDGSGSPKNVKSNMSR